MEVLTLTVFCHERRPPDDDIFLHPGTWRSRRSWQRWPRPRTGWATRPRLPDPRAVQVPTADARDGRRGNQPWSVITTPVSA